MAHIVIIGSGIAGLTAALRLAGAHDVTVVTKDSLGESNTAMAQGGIAGVLAAEDSVESHIDDTLIAGVGLNDEAAVRVLCTEGPDRILELAATGVTFDTDVSGRWARGMEGAHSVARIFHSGGDATGRAITDALVRATRAEAAAGRIAVREHSMLVDIVTEANDRGSAWAGSGPRGRPPTVSADGRADRRAVDAVASKGATGVSLLHDGALEMVAADAVVLATGGAGQLFAHTTNPLAATGDGLAASIRAGADVADLEFFQFHPTALAGAGFLISEAVRGAGAVLLDAHGHRFIPDIDLRAELAPRDVVALAIHRTMAAQNGEFCHLDARAIPEVTARFPSITRGLAAHGLDLATDLIPVTPAAHYYMGGIATDLDGRTSVDRLFAVGEVACTGVHGANRLASNSLLEGAVFGVRAAEAIMTLEPMPDFSGGPGDASCASVSISRDELRDLAWTHLGVERNETGLRALLDHLGDGGLSLTDRESGPLGEGGSSLTDRESGPAAADREGLETANLTLIARHIATHALARQESRGAHTRTDFPVSNTLPTQQRPASVTPAPTTSLFQEAASC
ncbi:L-aspartate oxidase [Brevibacterium sp. UCMA 11754]|uniref:L-aspartate oxidase n=1 Tax=Brevibacterium sp. UCMA 11754 TaxID=2749198 RepID=UPI001F38154D|nr:L-aspartate oxidase [Brevibacterium sp. UCMA 11754]MCF2573738.1 L-aspartate oxidase [Brevibacterium sp. UCMA 11754]